MSDRYRAYLISLAATIVSGAIFLSCAGQVANGSVDALGAFIVWFIIFSLCIVPMYYFRARRHSVDNREESVLREAELMQGAKGGADGKKTR